MARDLRAQDESVKPEPTLATRALRGVIWAYGSFVGGRLLVLGSTIVLARLLTPEDFGLVALAIAIMALLEGVSDLGLNAALVISSDERLEERAQTVFVTSVGLGAALSVVVFALSPLAASFFDQPDLVAIAAALGCNFFIGSLGSTHYALAQKKLDFRARTIAETADIVTRGSTGIILALTGFGAWSLVVGYLVGSVVMVVAIWIMVPFRPNLRANRRDFRDMVGYGGTISGVNVVATVIANVDYLFVGRILGAASLGLYTLAFRLPELLILNLSMVGAQVLVPAFSTVDEDSLGRTFLISLRYTLMIALPLSIALAILAEPITLTLFGPQWEGAAKVMPILVIYAFAVTVGVPAGAVYKATGRAGILLVLGVVRLAVLVGALALFADEGTVAAGLCQASVAVAAEIVGISLASRLLGVGMPAIARTCAPLLAAGAAMAVALAAGNLLIDGDLLTLLVAVPVGGLVYLGAVWALVPEAVHYLRSKLHSADAVEAGPPALPDAIEAEPTPYNVRPAPPP